MKFFFSKLTEYRQINVGIFSAEGSQLAEYSTIYVIQWAQ